MILVPGLSILSLFSSLVGPLAHGSKDEILRQLNTLLGANNLNGLISSLVPRHLDLAVALLADRIDLGAVGSDNMTVSPWVRKNKVSSGILLLSLLQSLGNGLLGLLNIFRGSTENPRDLAIILSAALDNLPRVNIGGSLFVVSDQGKSPTNLTGRGIRLGRQVLARVVDSNLVVVAELAEELAVVGDGVVEASRDLNGLTLLGLDEGQDVLLGLVHILGATGNLDSSLAVTLARDVDGDGELGFHLALNVTTAADEGTVVVDGNINNFSDLALALSDDFLNSLDDVLDNIGAALNLDCVAVCFLLGELNGARKFSSVIGTASLDDDVSEGCTYDMLALKYDKIEGEILTTSSNQSPVVLLVNVKSLNDSVIKDSALLLKNLLGLCDLRSSTLQLNFHNRGITVGRNVDLSAGGLSQLIKGSAALADEGTNLLLLDRNSGNSRVLLEILVE